MHVHLIEPRADGHRMQYVRRLVEAAPAGWRLSLSTFTSSLQHPGLKAAVEAGQGRITVRSIEGEIAFEQRVKGADGFALQPAYWRLLRRHWREVPVAERGDLVVVPYLDYCSYAIGLLGSPFGATPFSGIVMRQDFHWTEQGVRAPPSRHAGLKRWLFLRLLKHPHLRRLVTIDPSLKDWMVRHRYDGHLRLAFAADPADMQGAGGRDDARRRFGLRDGSFVVLLFGSIDLRKGVESLLSWAASAAFPTDAQVLVVGRQSNEVRALLDSRAHSMPPGRVVCVDRYVDQQDEWAAFAASDVVWVAYEGFYGSSGVVAQAGQVGLPLIHRGEGLIGYQLQPVTDVPPWLSASGLQLGRAKSSAPLAGDSLGQVFAA